MRQPESAPAPEQLKPAIAGEQKRIRRSIYNTVGKSVDFGWDTGEFLLESAAWATGKIVPTTFRTFKALYRGVTDKPYRHAA